MGSRVYIWSLGLIGLGLLLSMTPGQAQDILKDTEARLKLEAERVEREFTESRAAAYRRVRENPANLPYALDSLEGLLALVQNSRGLPEKTRQTYVATLKYDLTKVREIAAERKASIARTTAPLLARDSRPAPKAIDDSKGRVKSVDDLIKGRRDLLADSRRLKTESGLGRLRTYEGVERSAVPQAEEYKFPENWVELSKRRSGAAKMTPQEKAIMRGLESVLDVDFDRQNLQDVMDYLRKRSNLRISLDKKALEEVGVTYETAVTLKQKLSLRSILKKINAELGLAYVIKDEAILITSQARASQMAVTKTYYLGDLVAVPGFAFDPITSQLAMAERVNLIISQILSIDRQSWSVNNPDAVGSVTFNPATMSLIVRQTAEFHFKNFGASTR